MNELTTALSEIGCPPSELVSPLNWASIEELLEQFTSMDGPALGEARRRFTDFIDQPLRARQKKALAHLVDLLRETAYGAGAMTSGITAMEVADAVSRPPVP